MRLRFLSLTVGLFLLLSAHSATAETWESFHRAHRIHVYSVRWEDSRTRDLYARLLRNKIAASYHRFMASRPAPVASPASNPSPVGVLTWENADRIADCEASGKWDINNGNGFWGSLQFLPSTWFAWGGGPFDGVGPFPYSREEQIAVALGHSLSNWPVCGRLV